MADKNLEYAVVPIAGLGTRMLPATKSIPKEMLPIFDKPVIQHVVEEIKSAGFSKIIFITHSSKNAIGNHFDKSFELEATLEKRIKRSQLKEIKNISDKEIDLLYLRQGEALGLGHAIKCASTVVGKKPFAVVLPDRVLDKYSCNQEKDNLAKLKKHFLEKKKNCFLVSKVPQSEVNKFGIIKPKKISDKFILVEKIIEKPSKNKAPSNLASVGRYIFTADIFDHIPDKPSSKSKEIELTDAIQDLIDAKCEIHAIASKGQYFDCGDKVGYFEAFISFAYKDNKLGDTLKNLTREILE